MSGLTRRRYVLSLLVCSGVPVVLLVISPGVGTESASFGWRDAWRARLGWRIEPEQLAGSRLADADGDGTISAEEAESFAATARYVGFSLRLPRSLLAFQVGMTLALCGAAFQVLFRNPLADPYTLGIAGGGSLGALLAIRFGWTVSLLGISSVALGAFGGSLAVVAAVLFIARGARRLTSNELILGGVATGLFCGAMMMLVTAVSNERVTFEAVRWMMGSLDPIADIPGTALLPLMLPAWVVLIVSARTMNQHRLGDEPAAARGVNVAVFQTVCVLVCTLATAAVVAECGPIGFVGLVVPHVVVLRFGSDCRLLLPASALTGGAFLILCDWGSQLAMRAGGFLMGRKLDSATLPVGVITAIVGVPLFLALLRMRRR